HADTGCNTTDAPPAARQLLNSDHAVGIIGPETDDVASVIPIVTRPRVPTEFQGGGAFFDHNTNHYLWRRSPSDSLPAGAMALHGSGIHVVGSGVSASGEYLKAITYPVAHTRLVSIYGTSVTGPAADAFNQAFAQTFGAGVQPLANANYAYDAVISLALAMDKAGTTYGPTVVKAMKQVTNPPGTAGYAYEGCLNAVPA